MIHPKLVPANPHSPWITLPGSPHPPPHTHLKGRWQRIDQIHMLKLGKGCMTLVADAAEVAATDASLKVQIQQVREPRGHVLRAKAPQSVLLLVRVLTEKLQLVERARSDTAVHFTALSLYSL